MTIPAAGFSFGEGYGVMTPKGAPDSLLEQYDELWRNAAASAAFGAFCEEQGLLRLDGSRERGAEMTGRLASQVCWTLYDTGYVQISPDTIGIGR
jgi:hypothetical protein